MSAPDLAAPVRRFAIGIDAAAVDAGDGDNFAIVVGYCHSRNARRIYAVKGAGRDAAGARRFEDGQQKAARHRRR